jgi:hypothetical protein
MNYERIKLHLTQCVNVTDFTTDQFEVLKERFELAWEIDITYGTLEGKHRHRRSRKIVCVSFHSEAFPLSEGLTKGYMGCTFLNESIQG